MRLLHPRSDDAGDAQVRATRLRSLYTFPARPTWRALMVSTLDGSATGADGRSGSIGTTADARVFALQRSLADAVVVGAGTVRAEGYTRLCAARGQARPPLLVVVSASGSLPASLASRSDGQGEAVLVVPAAAAVRKVSHARRLLGEEHVWSLGDRQVDLRALRQRLTRAGSRAVLCEGGPSLLADLYAASLVDELSLTWVPQVVGGDGPRIAHGPGMQQGMRMRHLLEDRGTLLGLWRTVRR